MQTTRQLQDEILQLKKEKDVCILAHAYQSHDIWEVADYVGDSFGLSQKAASAPQSTILMCGVRFMAETVKILSPQKRVILSDPQAGCPMAEQMDLDQVLAFRKEHPDYAVVAYINTTAELKTVCDVCVTSSCAVSVLQNMDNDKILFIPDGNLGAWAAAQVPQKSVLTASGGCPIHMQITAEEVRAARALHPGALLCVHPECVAAVTDQADYVGSTTGIMDFAQKSEAKSFIIGTENSITQHLRFACPDKEFYPLSQNCLCKNMRLTTLPDVYRCLIGTAGEEIVLEEETRQKAKHGIDEMLRLGG